ncbi:MAG: hypothetical protein ABSC88_08430 [Terracidiphilus sp.]|jgi:hypothetical protein
MRRSVLIALLLGLFVGVANLSAKDSQPKYKNAEVKYFTNGDAVGLSQHFVNMFCDSLRAQLLKDKVAAQVVDEGAAVPEANAADSIVVEGKFTEFKKAGRTMASPGKMGWDINLYRKSDHSLITNVTGSDSTMPGWTEDQLAKGMAIRVSYLIKKALK